VDVVLFRDVAERHQVANLQALRYLQRSLVAHPAAKFRGLALMLDISPWI
jgi:hypothetical protein